MGSHDYDEIPDRGEECVRLVLLCQKGPDILLDRDECKQDKEAQGRQYPRNDHYHDRHIYDIVEAGKEPQGIFLSQVIRERVPSDGDVLFEVARVVCEHYVGGRAEGRYRKEQKRQDGSDIELERYRFRPDLVSQEVAFRHVYTTG